MKASRFTLPLVSALVALASLPASGAIRAWEPSDYVQEDLVLHYDGIRNVGADAAHDPAATTWKDLSPSGNDASTYVHSSASDNGAWGAKGFVFATDSYWQADARTSLTGDFTMQVACDTTQSSMQGTKSWPNLIGNNGAGASGSTDELSIFYHKGNKRLSAKFVSAATSGSGSGYLDQYLSAWNYKYATLLRSGAKASLFDGTEPTLVATYATPRDLGPDILVGSGTTDKNDGGSGDRRFTGTIYSVRIYDKALSNAELAWNRALDEARFHNAASVPESAFCASAVPDAVVATSIVGASGAESSGCYVVDDDGHTFRAAPFASVGGASYACTGYTLAAWDNAQGAWGAPVAHDGEYSVFVAAGDKVRIEWQWKASDGSLDAGYVTDRLAIRLDGIDNAGVGVHDAFAAVWKDLSGNGRDATLAGNADGSSHWEDKGFCFNKNAVFATTAQFQLGNRYTIEGLVDSAKTDYPDAGVNGQVFCNSVNNLSGGNPSYYGNLYYHKNQGKWMFLAAHVTDATWGADGTTLSDATLSYFTAFRDGPLVSLTNAAALPPSGQWAGSTKDEVPADDIWCFGANSATAVRSSNQWNFKGTFKSFRAYTRLLTDEELAHNRAVDDARFFGKIPATGCVVVQSAIAGLEGRESSGVYFPDGWTFSAGAGTNTVRGLGWVCAGYQLQAWDADASAWGGQQTVPCDGGSAVEWTSPSGTSFASVRLTWLWKPVSGIRTAADYAVADYAAGALAWHLDGIEHGEDASVWSDLSGNGRDATLYGNAAFGTDGLVLGNTDHARTAKTWALGKATTTEVAFDVDFEAIPADGKQYVFVTPCKEIATAGNGALYYKLGNRHVIWRTDKLTGTVWDTNAGVHDPSGAKFLTAIRNGSKTAVLTGTAYPTQTNVRGVDAQLYETWADGGKSQVIPAYGWEVGRWVSDNYSVPGTIKSVRQYDRLLSEDELAWNRKVDEVRFNGALTTTNVVLEATEWNGALAAGPYEVFGTHTFEASPSPEDGRLPTHVRVWTLRTDGTWASAGSVEGASYAYTPAAGTVKIEFRMSHPFVLIVR